MLYNSIFLLGKKWRKGGRRLFLLKKKDEV
jgi:hypothetical protein